MYSWDMGGEGGVVDQRLLPTHQFWSPHQVVYKRKSPIRPPNHPKEPLVVQGGPNFHFPVHRPLPSVSNVLLGGAPEEFLCLSLLLAVLLVVSINAFPILTLFHLRDVSVDDIMTVRGEAGINEGGHGAEENVAGILDAASGLVPGLDYRPLGG